MDKAKAKKKAIILAIIGVIFILAGPIFGWMSTGWALFLGIVALVAAVAIMMMAKTGGGGSRPPTPPTSTPPAPPTPPM
jgi:hypothetical protein